MLSSYLFVIFIFITPTNSTLQRIRYHDIDLLMQHTYIVSHITNKIGLGVNSPDLNSCIYTCFNHDFCRTAVFDSQLFICYLFEECSNQGQIVPYSHSTLISFVVCNGEPTSMAFVPLSTPIPVATAMSNLIWVKDITLSGSRFPFFINDRIYIPLQYVINVYETDTYTLIQTIQFPSSSGIVVIGGDSQDTFIYFQSGDSNLYIYSPSTNITTSTSTAGNAVFCYSKSFIVVTGWQWNFADVYRRSAINNSATFIYRIDNWNQMNQCVIINDQQLIGAILSGGMQTTMLNKTTYNSTIITLPLNTTYLPTGGKISTDAAGRIYTAPDSSKNASAIFLSDGTFIGVHTGTLNCAGKTSKYKFILMTTNGNTVSIFEYTP